jgi:hypothetical protein
MIADLMLGKVHSLLVRFCALQYRVSQQYSAALTGVFVFLACPVVLYSKAEDQQYSAALTQCFTAEPYLWKTPSSIPPPTITTEPFRKAQVVPLWSMSRHSTLVEPQQTRYNVATHSYIDLAILPKISQTYCAIALYCSF